MAQTKTQELQFNVRLYNVAPNGDARNAKGHVEIVFNPVITGGGGSGLANDATTYSLQVQADASATPSAVTITGSAAQTFTTVASTLQTAVQALGGVYAAATVVVVNSGAAGSGISLISGTTAATTGLPSTFNIIDGVTGTGGGMIARWNGAGAKPCAIATSVDGENGQIDVLTINGKDVRGGLVGGSAIAAEVTTLRAALLQTVKDYLD